MSQGAMDGGVTYGWAVLRKEPGRRCAYVQDVRVDFCSSAIAPALPNKLHPCNDAKSTLPPSVVVG
jgi:hypothetical protein